MTRVVSCCVASCLASPLSSLVEGKVHRASGGLGPVEALMHGALQLVQLGRVADEYIQPSVESVHPMNQQGEIDARLPDNGIPG